MQLVVCLQFHAVVSWYLSSNVAREQQYVVVDKFITKHCFKTV